MLLYKQVVFCYNISMKWGELMTKYETKQLFVIIIFGIINVVIAYAITIPLGISNIVLYKTLTAMEHTITYETIIFMALSLLESLVYHYKYEM